MKGLMLLLSGVVIAVASQGLLLYLLMPMPGSQTLDSLNLAYGLSQALPWILLPAAGLIVWGLWRLARVDIGVGPRFGGVLLMAGAAWAWSWIGEQTAPVMFKAPSQVEFARGTSEALPPETLVLGIRAGDEIKAYPLRLLAYHHQVRDELAGQPIWVTYCSMCRTGKVFRPRTADQELTFELVGALNYNSVYRDQQTGSWWFQANGKAAVGPLEGEVLDELLADQMTLASWLELYPDSQIFQPDPAASDGYSMFGFDSFDQRTSNQEGALEWQWVVGVVHGDHARAYPWSALSGNRLVHDQLAGLPLAIQLSEDGFSHRVWDRRVAGQVLDFQLAESGDLWHEASGTAFDFDGRGQGGDFDGESLQQVASTNEFQHSFLKFSGGDLWQPPAASEPSPPASPTASAPASSPAADEALVGETE